MRSALFNAYYWAASVFYVLAAAVLSLVPGDRPVSAVVRLYTRRMLWGMRALAGIDVTLKGQENLPPGACIIAAKHHSWGDGFVMFAGIDNLAFVTGDHLERFPLIGTVLKKLGAIVVDRCGGRAGQAKFTEQSARANAEGRRILIYPEGHLAAPGQRFRYRSGVYQLYAQFGAPVAPVATNLGLFWDRQSSRKTPGAATVEILPAIPPGLGKLDFMRRLEEVIETRTDQLIAEATGQPVRPATLVTWDEKRKLNVPAAG